MTKKDWQNLLKHLETNDRMGKLRPVAQEKLDAFERKRAVKLPRSYRTFCEVFGPGEFGTQFQIAVPGYKGKAVAYSLEYLDGDMAHSGLEYEIYSKNSEQHKRGILFSLDIVRSYHFFDPADITDKTGLEYAVYTLFSDFKVRRACDNFWQFVTEFCLGDKHRKLIKSPAPKQMFMPVGV